MAASLLMIIDDLHVYWALGALRPFKANPPPVIEAYAILAFAVAFKSFQTVAGQAKIGQGTPCPYFVAS